MKINAALVSAPTPPSTDGAPSTRPAPTTFRQVMQRASAPQPAAPSLAESPMGSALRGVAASHREMDRIIRVVASGRSFTSAQLIGLQARVHRLSTEIDLASKLLEKATSGVKQAMSTQL